MRHHNALNVGLLQVVLDAGGQCRPDGKGHVLAVNLRDLLAQQITLARQRWNACHELINTQLGSGAVDVVGS